MQSDILKMAIKLADMIRTKHLEVNAVNRDIKNIFSYDFPPYVALMPDQLESDIVALLDKIINDETGIWDMASYYIYECNDRKGGLISCEDKDYEINNIDELNVFINDMLDIKN